MNDCEHQEECVVRERYPELCYQNMTDLERLSLGDSCPVADEYQNVPDDYLVCPTGIIRKLMHGDSIRGERL
jgi:hypothetical protein